MPVMAEVGRNEVVPGRGLVRPIGRHLAYVYFSDVNEGLSKHSKECIDNVRPYYQMFDVTTVRLNFGRSA
jgi:hypothetical protein